MNPWPLVTRELQAEARRPFTYWLRVLGAGAVLVAFVMTSLTLAVPPGQHGPYLFQSLNSALSIAIWVLVPVLTADCVSREKREGTLGLLFLTPLSALDIVVSKAVVHGLRAATLVLAAFPLVSLPMVLGGVGWNWAVHAFSYQLSALLLALAAGLIASVQTTEWTQALIKAELLSGLLATGLVILQTLPFALTQPNGRVAILAGLILFLLFRIGSSRATSGPPPLLTPNSFEAPEARHARRSWRSSNYFIVAAVAVVAAATWTLFGPLFLAVFAFVIVVRQSARWVQENWQKELAAPPQPEWVKVFSGSEFWRNVFRWNKGRTLDRNPIAWLQEYSWTARLTKWGWCVLLLLGEFVAVATPDFVATQITLTSLVIVGLAFTASGSFRRERQTGALELLLVAPLRARQLIGGRIWGIWCHFLPAMAVAYCFWMMTPYRGSALSGTWLLFGLSSFVFLPPIGLHFSMQRMNFLVAWLATCGVGLLLPWVPLLLLWQDPNPAEPLLLTTILCALQGITAVVAGFKLQANFVGRRFALEHAN